MSNCNVAVLGIGNLLLSDDGVGIHAVEMMKTMAEFQNIELIDGGTSIFDTIDIFMRNNKIIIVDSIKGGHTPGSIYKLTLEDLENIIREVSSLHQVQILDIIKWVKYMGYSPEVVIIGVEPKEIDYAMRLSPLVEKALPKLIKEIIRELQ